VLAGYQIRDAAIDCGSFCRSFLLEHKPVQILTLTMKMFRVSLVACLRGAVLASLVIAASSTRASTIWNGATTNFTHSAATGDLSDQLTAGVSFSRSTSGGGLYNANTEGGATSGISPKDTAWAVGSLANFNTLTYGACPLESGDRPPNRVGTTYVVHLTNEDIYLSLTLTAWGGAGGSPALDKSFSYTRSTPAVASPPPTIGITNPASGAVFVTPANVSIMTTNSGAITNVQFFTNSVLLGTVLTAPFNLTNNLPAGAYALKAVATAGGISATSAVVNITVDTPPTVNVISPTNNTTLSAPANVTIQATASDSDGSVTNLQLLVGSTVLTSAGSAPLSGMTNNLAAGSYTFSAIASDNLGVKNTNSISISVVTPVTNTISGVTATASSTNFQFSYQANVGLSYVVQRSTNLGSTNWLALFTNTATSGTVIFTDNNATNDSGYYRVGRLPNP
jgi:hypothetical protein